MNKRQAKKQACTIVANQIWQWIAELGQPYEGHGCDGPSHCEECDRIVAGCEEVRHEMMRRGVPS